MTIWVNAIVPIAIRGKAMGGLTTSVFLGQFFSPIFTQPLAKQIGLGPSYGVVGIAVFLLSLGLLMAFIRLKTQTE